MEQVIAIPTSPRDEAVSGGTGVHEAGVGILPVVIPAYTEIQHQQGRWCLQFGSGGRPCPPFPGPRIGVRGDEYDQQFRVPRGTVPPMRLLSRIRDRSCRTEPWQPQLLYGKVSVFLQEANRLFQSVSAEGLRQDFRISIRIIASITAGLPDSSAAFTTSFTSSGRSIR